MTSPLDKEDRAPAGNATRLPALGVPDSSPDFLDRVKEILEVLLGRRGASDWDRAVTFRDLYNLNLAPSSFGSPGTGAPGAPQVGGPVGTGPRTITLLEAQLRETEAYKALLRRIGSAEDLAMFPDEIRAQLSTALANVARERQADIQLVERKMQSASMSLASRMMEITAAVEQSAAGVRHLDASYADKTRALATSITQVAAQLGDIGGAEIEERFLAIADQLDGLLAQWTLKVQTNPVNGQPPVFAGISVAAESPVAGPGTSAILFMAEKFGFFTNNGAVMPFGIDNNGNVYVNGTLRINDGGPSLGDLNEGRINYIGEFASPPDPSGQQVNDLYRNTSNGATYILNDVGGVKSWAVWVAPGAQGPQGVQGPQGNQGVQGPAGADGQPTYTWIKYGTSDAGADMTDLPNGSTTHIGIAVNKSLQSESSNPADYVWSKFRGDDGVPGAIGANGQTTYTWIKYATSATGANLSNDPSGKTYVGFAYNKLTAEESTTPSDYNWSLIQGPQGPQGFPGQQGNQGVPGPQGPQGQQLYTWIKYGTSANGDGMTDAPDSDTTHIGIAVNKTTPIESSFQYDYVWSAFRGAAGVPGPIGPNGQPTYTWIKYGTSAVGANMSDSPVGASHIGFAYNKTTMDESDAPGDYLWSRILGDPGPQGPPGTGAQGPAGERGTIDIAVSGHSGYSGKTATDATNVFLGATGYYPINRDRMTLYNSATSETRFYNNGSWLTISAWINGNMVVDGTFSASKISGGSITSSTINIGNGNFRVQSDGTVTAFGAGLARPSCYNSSLPTAPSITCTSEGSGPGISVSSASGNAINITGGSNGIVQTGGGGNYLRTLVPATASGFDLGISGSAWRDLFVSNSPTITSDMRTKTDIMDSELGLSFINDLRPVQYRQILAENIVADNYVEIEPARSFVDDFGDLVEIDSVIENQPIITPRQGVRTHHGLLAQEVKQSLDDHGATNAAMWTMANKDDPLSQQALRYEELIAPLIRSVQELSSKVDAQAAEIAALTAQLGSA